MSSKKKILIENYESIEEFQQLNINDIDSSDTGSNIDDNDYLSDEELTNKYTFLQKPKKRQNNQYKEQFKPLKKKSIEELKEEAYVSD